jgi:PncC family amidohydrolase
MRKKINNDLVKILLKNELTLALAESVTCGMAAHQLSTVTGTSAVLKGSIVCYHESVKTDLIGIPASLIQKHTAESQQVTNLLAKKLTRLIDADIHAAITGLAAPGGSETGTKPVGTIFFSVIYKRKMHTLRKKLTGTPTAIRKKACNKLYQFILDIIHSDHKCL